MTREDVLAELDKRFADHMEAEVARMRAEGIGEGIIAAVVAENEKRFAETRLTAADTVLGPTVH